MMEAIKCYCTLVASEEGLDGCITGMVYQSKGIFICPECKEKRDLSEFVYNVVVKIEKEDGYNVLKIIGGDERIHKHFHDDPEYLIVKNCIEDDLNEGCYTGDWVSEQKEGTFELEVFYQPYQYMTDCGTEYDLDMFIINEKEKECDV